MVKDFAVNDNQSFQMVQDEDIKGRDYMAKLDLSNTYRSVKVHPDDHQLLGLSWDIKLRAVYYPGRYNTLADAASRLHQKVWRHQNFIMEFTAPLDREVLE